MTPAEVAAALPRILRKLPREARELVAVRLRWEVYPVPRAVDLERGRDVEGFNAQSPAYFWGRGIEDDPDVLEEDDTGELAEPIDDAGGVVVLFARNIAGLAELETAVQHEVAHFMGADDDEIEEVDGDVSEDPEIIDDPEDEER
jgi:hypothetical protein